MRRFFADRQSRACDSTSQALLFLCLSSRYGQKSNIQGGKLLLEMLARVPQVSRETFWCLREFRKCLGKLFGVCGSPASNKKCFSAFAEVPQATKSTFQHLRKFRKSRGKCFGVCGYSRKSCGKCFGVCNTVASLSKGTLAVTARFSIGKPYMSRYLKVLLDRCTTHATHPNHPTKFKTASTFGHKIYLHNRETSNSIV